MINSRVLPSDDVRDLLELSREGDAVELRLSFDLLPDELVLS